jgi:uncharacterized protein with HEPN domain
MPRRNAVLYLQDILACCDAVTQFAQSRTVEDLRNDRYFRSATERELSVIGEAVTQLIKARPDLAGRITDVSGIVRFRNILVHAYDIVDLARMWQSIQEDIPVLRAESLAILHELELMPPP